MAVKEGGSDTGDGRELLGEGGRGFIQNETSVALYVRWGKTTAYRENGSSSDVDADGDGRIE